MGLRLKTLNALLLGGFAFNEVDDLGFEVNAVEGVDFLDAYGSGPMSRTSSM